MRSPRLACSRAERWTPTRAPGSGGGPTAPFVYSNYADAELGYAVTDHVAQSRTVHTGLAVFSGTEARPHGYVASTRGTARRHELAGSYQALHEAYR
jgi:hypothetical protein